MIAITVMIISENGPICTHYVVDLLNLSFNHTGLLSENEYTEAVEIDNEISVCLCVYF